MHTPGYSEDFDIEMVAETRSQKDQSNDHQKGGKMRYSEADLDHKDTFVVLNVSFLPKVGCEVSNNFSEQDAHNRSKEQEAKNDVALGYRLLTRESHMGPHGLVNS